MDPGLTRCGFGLIDMAGNRTASFVDVGVAGTDAADPLDVRVLRIWEATERWIERYRPDALALERVFAQTNVNTVIGTAHASGAVIASAARHGVPVAWHTPSEVKAAVTGEGRADKASVARMVVRILRLDEAPRPADERQTGASGGATSYFTSYRSSIMTLSHASAKSRTNFSLASSPA